MTNRATKSNMLFAASRLARTGTFTTARVVAFLGVYGQVVRSLDVASHIEGILTANGYVTDEAGTFAAI